MSFGFSIGDFLAVIELINKVCKDFASAPEQFQQICKELECLENAIRPIKELSSKEDLSSTQQKDLTQILENCNGILQDAQKIVNKYRESLEPEGLDTGQKAPKVRKRLRWVPDCIRRKTPGKHPILESEGIEIRKEVKRIWKRVQFEPEDVRELRSRMTLSVTYCNAFRDKLREDQKQKRNILAWLSRVNYSAQQSDLIHRRQAGTGQWLLDSSEYRHWVATKREILFCPGIPGAGKTILASIVVDNLVGLQRVDRSIAVCYIFLNFRQNDEQKLEHLLASLLTQLSQTQRGISETMKSLGRQYMSKNKRPSVSELRQALCSVGAEFSRVYIIIDALDECETDNCQRDFISELLAFGSNFEANVLATSRFIPTITSRFGSATTKEIRASDEDIDRYLDGNLSRLHGFISRDTTLQTEIKKSIMKCVDGMFLLAQLHLESIKNTISRKDVRVALSKLGKGSDAYDIAYEDAMIRINSQLPRHQDLALRTLFWITYAKRPLTTIELRHALSVELETTGFDEDNLPDLDDMVTYCCGLVTVDKGRDIIRLVHYTTQEYFERTGTSWFPGAQFQIGRTCITYLSFDAFQSGMCTSSLEYEQRLLAYPFYKYACNYGAKHAYLASDYQYCAVFLGKPSEVEACAQALWGLKSARRPLPTKLHIAALLGLDEVLKIIVENEDPDPSDYCGETPIYEAIKQGHLSVVQLLLEKGANVNSMIRGWPLLERAAILGREAIVRLLLDRGAEVDLGSTEEFREGETALSSAARSGHEPVVRLLLERGASVNFNGGSYEETPLYIAAFRGHRGVARLLLENGADINSKDSFGMTPLSKAAESGNVDMVRFLLANDADPDIEDYSYKTALQYLAECRHIDRTRKLDMVRLLLESEADTDCEDRYTKPPLWSAINAHDEELIRLLLEHGADTECKGDDHRTPLYLATELGHLDVVRLLLEKGAEVDGKETGCGQTPLTCAATQGNQDIVRLLLQKGADINCQDRYGNALLEWVNSEMKRFLIENGNEVKPHIKRMNSEDEECFREIAIWDRYDKR